MTGDEFFLAFSNGLRCAAVSGPDAEAFLVAVFDVGFDLGCLRSDRSLGFGSWDGFEELESRSVSGQFTQR